MRDRWYAALTLGWISLGCGVLVALPGSVTSNVPDAASQVGKCDWDVIAEADVYAEGPWDVEEVEAFEGVAHDACTVLGEDSAVHAFEDGSWAVVATGSGHIGENNVPVAAGTYWKGCISLSAACAD